MQLGLTDGGYLGVFDCGPLTRTNVANSNASVPRLCQVLESSSYIMQELEGQAAICVFLHRCRSALRTQPFTLEFLYLHLGKDKCHIRTQRIIGNGPST